MNTPTPIFKKAEYATKLLFFACGFAFASWAARIPEIKEKLNLNDAQLGNILLFMTIGSICALPLAGFIIGKFGSRKIIVLACCFYFTSMPFLGFCTTAFGLACALFYFGFGADLLNISMNVQAVNVEKAQNRSIMSFIHGVFSVGFFVGASLGGLCYKFNIQPNVHLSVVGTFVILAGIFSFKYLIKTDFKSSESAPLFALPDKSLILLAIICFCGMMAEGAMADWSVLYYKIYMTNPAGYITAAFTCFSVCMLVGRFLGDWAVAKFGLKTVLIFNSILFGIGMFFAVVYPKPICILVSFGVVGLGLSTMVPLIYAKAGHTKTMSPGAALAAISTVGIAGFLIGPVLIGHLSEASSLRVALSSLVVLAVISSFLCSKIKN